MFRKSFPSILRPMNRDCVIATIQRCGRPGVVRRLLIRRLKIRYEHRADIHLAFLQLGFALISLAFLG